MNDIKKVLIVAICVVLVIAIAAGVSIGVMANTMNGLKDRVEELDQAYASDVAAMKAEIEAAKAANENLVTAADFEAKLAAAIGEQNQTMQSLISTAVKNQIEDLEVEGLTEEQVNEIIDAAVANCLTEADIDAIIADIDTGLTKDEVKKLITNNTAGYLTYAQIMNLIEDEAYDLRAFLEAQINGLGTSVANKTAKVTLNAADYVADCTLTATQLDNIVSGGKIVLKGDWSTKTLYINYAGAKDFIIDVTGITLDTLDIEAVNCHVELTGDSNTHINHIYAHVASNSLIISGGINVGKIEVTNGRVVVGEDTKVEEILIQKSDVKLENEGEIESVVVSVNANDATITNEGAIEDITVNGKDTTVENNNTIGSVTINATGADVSNSTGSEIGDVYVDDSIDSDDVKLDETIEPSAKSGVTTEAELIAAIENAKDGDKIEIAENIKLTDDRTLTITKNIVIAGASDNVTVTGKKTVAESNGMFSFAAENATIKNLTLVFTSTGRDTAAVWATSGNLTVDNVTFLGADKLASVGQESAIISEGYAGEITVTNSSFENFKYAIYLNGTTGAVISNNTFDGTLYNAINVAGGEKVEITDNTMKNISYADYAEPIYSSGIYVANGVKAEIGNNTIEMLNGKLDIYEANEGKVTATTVADSEAFKTALTDTESAYIIVELEKDVTYDIGAWQTNAMGGEATKAIIINGNDCQITFNQTNSDWNNIVTNGAKLVINNAHVTSSGHNDGPWNRHDLNFACDVELNVVTSDKAMAFKANATLNVVTIYDANTSDTYAIWIQPNGQTVALNNCNIDMIDCTDGRGIAINEQYVDEPAKVTLKVSNSHFKTEEKGAIIVKSMAGADITIDNVDISGVVADKVNVVWVDSDCAASYDLVTVAGATKFQEQ